MKDLLSIKLDLIRFELLTIKRLRGNSLNCAKKNKAISERIFELEQLIEKIRGAFK
tara:strand:- start:2384 stop:2551 length:168 start_codon:yes stop_codon:yes gene_type:complete